MRYVSYQPEHFTGDIDEALPQHVRELARLLELIQRDFAHNTLRLGRRGLQEIAGILADFAVDIHCAIGIWDAYERYNVEFFGVPLPLTTVTKPDGIHKDRIRHLLWVLYPDLVPELVLSPGHADLERLAAASASFLRERICSLPRDSGVKAFLATPNEFGWDVKRKLVWLGAQSYLFRLPYAIYMAEHGRSADVVADTDDFICQEPTEWSGLGAIDILAAVLDISESERKELRSWYERHVAPYRILAVTTETQTALNLISNEPYTIRVNMDRSPFKAGAVVFGSLTPWRGEWYWSGQQQVLPSMTPEAIDDLAATMRRRHPDMVCHYCKDYERQIREQAAKFHERMMAYNKSDLRVYPDGLTMAADWQKEMKSMWDAAPPEAVKDAIKRHGLTHDRPNMPLPDDLVNSKNGIAVFINPHEGKEIVKQYNDIVSGLKKQGEDLSDAEAAAMRGIILDSVMSPAFVRRIVSEYGSESIREAFLLRKCPDAYWLEYLLRSRKGRYFRKRYPSISII